MRKSELEILVGMIGSGKSTYARARAEQGAVVVNHDAIVLMVHGGNYSLYDPTLKVLYKQAEMNLILTALALGRDVVVDRTNLKREARAKFITLAKAVDCPVICTMMEFDTPNVHAKRRWGADGRGQTLAQWTAVAELHMSQYESPIKDEGFERIEVITWGMEHASD